jgi:hydroxyethylthiazole kinase
MRMDKKLTDRLLKIRNEVREKSPLIHCITNPISINDCANMVLATGAKPIMAEHPDEVADITAVSAALAVNLGNITDVRMKSMRIAGETAQKMHLPVILDLVGVGCSRLRRDYAKIFIEKCRPSVIKGNVSELRALCGFASSAEGIDAGALDKITPDNRAAYEKMLGNYAKKYQAVLVASGAYDFITDGSISYLVANGTPHLAQITGTGCMLNVLAGSFLSSADPMGAVLLAALLLGIAGEHAAAAKGPGSFRAALLDEVYALQDEILIREAKLI